MGGENFMRIRSIVGLIYKYNQLGVKAPYQVIVLTVRSGPHKGASFRLRQQMVGMLLC